MRKIIWVLTASFIVLGFAACNRGKQNFKANDQVAAGPAPSGKMPKIPLKPGSYVPGEILVKFKEGVSPEKARDIVQGLGYEVKVKTIPVKKPWDHWLTVLLPEEIVVRVAMQKAASHPGVEYVQPNWIYRLTPPAGK